MPDEKTQKKGQLRIILGYAAGIGKTYKMLEEGHRLLEQGHDVVVGYFESHRRKDTIEKSEGLPFISRRTIHYRDRDFEEMDTQAILDRKPEVCLVDEFPHTNVPGAERTKRWEDVLVLLDAGIDVITTMNIQHLESLNDQMREVTGVKVRETIPDWVVNQASEVVMVDLTPGALLNRLDRGVVYGSEKAKRARENFFKEETLAALREMAMRQTAHEVEMRQPDSHTSRNPSSTKVSSDERILIHLTEAPSTAGLIRRGRRVADYLTADCVAVCVVPSAGINSLPSAQKDGLCQQLDFARKLQIETQVLEGDDAAQTLVEFAHSRGITQIFLSKPVVRAMPILSKNHLVMKVVRLARDIQVTVVSERRGN